MFSKYKVRLKKDDMIAHSVTFVVNQLITKATAVGLKMSQAVSDDGNKFFGDVLVPETLPTVRYLRFKHVFITVSNLSKDKVKYKHIFHNFSHQVLCAGRQILHNYRRLYVFKSTSWSLKLQLREPTKEISHDFQDFLFNTCITYG